MKYFIHRIFIKIRQQYFFVKKYNLFQAVLLIFTLIKNISVQLILEYGNWYFQINSRMMAKRSRYGVGFCLLSLGIPVPRIHRLNVPRYFIYDPSDGTQASSTHL
jgi:hypothetical protein